MDDNIEEIKILFVGDSRAGKTSIISQFSNGVVEDDFNPTTPRFISLSEYDNCPFSKSTIISTISSFLPL